MIYLDKTTRKLEMVLDAAVATNQLTATANYFDVGNVYGDANSLVRGSMQASTSNSTTDVTLVNAPVNNIIRNVKSIFINNKDTATRIVTVKLDDNGTESIIAKVSLTSGQTLCYEDGFGWSKI